MNDDGTCCVMRLSSPESFCAVKKKTIIRSHHRNHLNSSVRVWKSCADRRQSHQSAGMGPKKRTACLTNDPEQYTSHQNPEFQHLICVICEGMYTEPQQCSSEHYFCRSCITNWITRSQTCPIDRSRLTIDDLRPAPRILSDMIQSLQIRCRYHLFGCKQGLSGETSLAHHLLVCDWRWHPLRDHDYCASRPDPRPDVRRPGTGVDKVRDWLERGMGGGGDDGLFQRPKFDPRSYFL